MNYDGLVHNHLEHSTCLRREFDSDSPSGESLSSELLFYLLIFFVIFFIIKVC